MKKSFTFLLVSAFLVSGVFAQDTSIKIQPTVTLPDQFSISPPLRDIPPTPLVTENGTERNEELKMRNYPFAETALPKGPDEAWQKEMGTSDAGKSPMVNFEGLSQVGNIRPPDTQGDVGPDHYFQVVNSQFQIWDKEGNSLLGPTNLVDIWSGMGIANISDPIVIYDEQADRWFISVFGKYSYKIFIAVSQTGDPTGSWYRWAYNWATKPDYAKYSVWRDGYYYASNTNGGQDVGVLERSVLLTGGAGARFLHFSNANRPASGFHCIMPLDNDGDFAASGTHGQFITMNDDAWGGSDQLWIYELDVNWNNIGLSTFSRTQTINVTAFDSNFGAGWDNIAQPGTGQELDGIPQVLMFRAQYRNFGTYQSIVCCHSVDVDNTDHAGVRWYELRRTTGNWWVRQQSTYAPDSHSRWMGSIAMNSVGDIALGYSVSSSSVYPSIRYTGRKAGDALNTMSIPESSILAGSNSQDGSNRWGDYSMMSVDPTDDIGFWYTNEYSNGGIAWSTRIANFSFGGTLCYAGSTSNCNADDEYISNVEIGSIDNATGCNQYADYTALSADIPKNSSEQITVSNGYGWGSDQCGIWVDWNQDGDFYDSGEEITVTGTPGLGDYTATIDPPASVSVGQDYVMRVRITYTGDLLPCGVTSFGEVEDYTIHITDLVPNYWTGNSNNYWGNPNNWSLLHAPLADEEAIVPNVNQPCIVDYNEKECGSLEIQAGAEVIVNAGELTIHNNITIGGQLSATHTDAVITCYGDVVWESGSTANFSVSSVFWVYGNWNFDSGANVQLDNGYVDFIGNEQSWIRSHSSICNFNHISSYKHDPYWLRVSDLSTQDLHVDGNIYTQSSSNVGSYSDHQVVLKGNLYNNGTFDFGSYPNTGTFVFDGTTQSIVMNAPDGIFNNLTISPTTSVVMTGDIQIVGNLIIESGQLNPQDHTITIEGDWNNNVGPDGFLEGTGRVIFYGPLSDNTRGLQFPGENAETIPTQSPPSPDNTRGHQYCSDEMFNILEVARYGGGAFRLNGTTVTCNSYDWTQGALDVLSGTFTALDLADNGLYGSFYTNPGGYIHLYQDTNSGSYIDLNGIIQWKYIARCCNQ